MDSGVILLRELCEFVKHRELFPGQEIEMVRTASALLLVFAASISGHAQELMLNFERVFASVSVGEETTLNLRASHRVLPRVPFRASKTVFRGDDKQVDVAIDKVSAWDINGKLVNHADLVDLLSSPKGALLLHAPWPKGGIYVPVERQRLRDDTLFLYTPPVLVD